MQTMFFANALQAFAPSGLCSQDRKKDRSLLVDAAVGVLLVRTSNILGHDGG